VLVFAGLLVSGLGQSQGFIIAAIALAAGLWTAAALLFSTLEEQGEAAQTSEGIDFSLLREDPALRRFILVRGLLVSTALAPPYLVILASDGGAGQLGQLGALVMASALASLLSSYVWGRLADRSSRQVLILTGALGAAAMVAAVALWAVGLAGAVWAMPAVLFVLMIAYHGVRQGRSTYLVDMAPEDRRSAYAALSNTIIGGLLLLAGVLGGGAALLGAQATLMVFAAMAVAASLCALALPEAEQAQD
jgi:predicted MFS family arabinose efflux permease